jgi:hypothetical protein
MVRATPASLTDKERSLLAETQRAHLATLDEDELAALHLRVRRARDKFVQLHRREVGEQVGAAAARGKVSGAPRRSAGKAEIFEDALARVSTALARAARQSAAALRAERLAAAAGTNAPPVKARRPPKQQDGAARAERSRSRTPAERKSMASTKATGARRQARLDAR